jgi:hypothetical protein
MGSDTEKELDDPIASPTGRDVFALCALATFVSIFPLLSLLRMMSH